MTRKGADGGRRGPHPATVMQPKAPHPAAVMQPKAPHPATVQAKGSAQFQAARPPHPARLPRPAAGAPGGPGGAVQRMELVVTGPTFALPHGGLVMWDFEPKEPAGMTIRGVTEGEKEVTLDSRVVPHVTSTVVNALNQVNVAKRTPTDMMKLSTGLVFRTLFDNRTSVSEDELMKTRKTKVAVVGLLGGVVLTYCAYSPPAVMKLNSIRTQIRQTLLKHKIDHVEVGNDDPRHIGSHDPFGVIPGTHFHLVLAAPGLTEGAQKAIESVLEEGLK